MILTDNNTVIARNDYYAFGKKHQNPNLQAAASSINRWLYNGKEWQTTADLGFLDYGARMYDSGTGRWLNLDNLLEKYYPYSPYNYTLNNPIKFVDPDGNRVKIFAKVSMGSGYIGAEVKTAVGGVGGKYSSGGGRGELTSYLLIDNKAPYIGAGITLNSVAVMEGKSWAMGTFFGATEDYKEDKMDINTMEGASMHRDTHTQTSEEGGIFGLTIEEDKITQVSVTAIELNLYLINISVEIGVSIEKTKKDWQIR